MPKIVDHDRRRDEVIAATWRIISTSGVANATTREIAREAGYSNGVLAHYFTDKADILTSTLVAAHRNVRARTDRRTSQLRGLDALWILMLESLPLDKHRVLEAKVEVSFWGQAIGNTKLVATQNDEVDGFRQRVRRFLEEAQSAGELREGAHIDTIVTELHVLMDGLSVQAAFYPAIATRKMQLCLLQGLFDRIQSPAAAERRAAASNVRS